MQLLYRPALQINFEDYEKLKSFLIILVGGGWNGEKSFLTSNCNLNLKNGIELETK